MVFGPTQVIVGGLSLHDALPFLHCELLLQTSVAFQVRIAVNVLPQPELVMVLTTVIAGAGSQRSVALGASKVHAVPHSMVFGPTQVIVGGVVSATVTVWLH